MEIYFYGSIKCCSSYTFLWWIIQLGRTGKNGFYMLIHQNICTLNGDFNKVAERISHLVFQWHLGFFQKEYTPTFRGFDSHYGYWTSHEDYFDHHSLEVNPKTSTYCTVIVTIAYSIQILHLLKLVYHFPFLSFSCIFIDLIDW